MGMGHIYDNTQFLHLSDEFFAFIREPLMLWRSSHDVTEYAHTVMHERDDPDPVLIEIVNFPRLAFERFCPFERQKSTDFVS